MDPPVGFRIQRITQVARIQSGQKFSSEQNHRKLSAERNGNEPKYEHKVQYGLGSRRVENLFIGQVQRASGRISIEGN